MSQDIVADGLNQIMNAKIADRKEVILTRYSKLLLNILEVAKNNDYLDYNLDKKKKELKIKILNINECRAIKPRFPVNINTIEKYMRRYLPSRGFGILIITTSKGVMKHSDAFEKNTGGSLVAYFY